jgi:two-component system, sensor histidine kinase ChiS
MNNSVEKEIEVLVAATDTETLMELNDTFNKMQPAWHLSVIGSGKECLSFINNGICPDLIILDINLSDMSGIDLIPQIRDDSDIPIIILSSEKNIETLIASFESGANDYIVKPFNKAIFIARLKTIVRRRL